MFSAAQNGDVAAIRQLLAAGVAADVRNKLKETPLMRAAKHDQEAAFQALVAAGADLHASRGYGESVLRFAVSGNSASRFRMVQAILGAGGIKPEDGLANAFALACRASNIEIVSALLGAGAAVSHEYLPLLKAVQANRPEIVAALVKAGANVNVRVPAESFGENKHWKKTLLELARAEGFTEVAQLLEAAGAKLPAKKARPAKPVGVAASWKRIVAWIGNNAPGWTPLQPPATVGQIEDAERALGFRLPEDLRESYTSHNGSGDLFPTAQTETYSALPLEELVDHWKMQKELVEKREFADLEPKSEPGIKNDWWNIGWVPFAWNGGGDYYCVDIAPGDGGTPGQVITHNHENGEHKRLAPSLREWLSQFASDLEDGLFRLDEKHKTLV
jgi:cell wall assembly regulator SMI1